MVADADPADPKDGPDNEESGIPAAYTYLGQFIDHDLTFDPASSLQRQNDPDALVDFRTPRLDLDNVYGRGPDDQPYLYADGRSFLLGKRLAGEALGNLIQTQDLPRSDAKSVQADLQARAIIGDPRNDENVIVSQLQGLFLRFHNRFAKDNPALSFAEVQSEVRFHYQWVVVNDFLPRIASAGVLDDVLPHLTNGTNPLTDPPRLNFYHFRNSPFMPLEFSVAGYRFGHSMVRPGYRLNDNIGPLSIFDPTDAFGVALTGFDEFPDDWAIDWARFVDREPRPFGNDDPANPDNKKRMQLAYKIDTSIVNPLGALPPHVASDPPASLPQRNLLRGWRLRLPTGQDVAQSMGLTPLEDSDIKIGKFSTGDGTDIKGDIVEVAGPEFAGNCPLWTYVLAETEEVTVPIETTAGLKDVTSQQLGPVGGRIVAETFAGILLGDSTSYFSLAPAWRPTLGEGGVFHLKDLVAYALGS